MVVYQISNKSEKVEVNAFSFINIYEVMPYRGKFTLSPGERKLIGRIIGKNEYVYVEYPDGNRIVLDYDLYRNIYEMMRSIRMEKLIVNGVKFFSVGLEECFITVDLDSFSIHNLDFCLKNEYEQILTSEVSIILMKRDQEQPLFTKDGVIWKKIAKDVVINKGECVISTTDKYSICFGDP